ncbi:MAG: hypothetical protein ACXU86_11485, partial [Archangium sp.]
MWEAFVRAREIAEMQKVPLRLRLFIEHGAADLHAIHWETLRAPEDGTSLLMDERLLFSRYLSSWDWRPVRTRSRGELRALVMIANPSDLAQWRPEGRILA